MNEVRNFKATKTAVRLVQSFLLLSFVLFLGGCAASVQRTELFWPPPPEKPRIEFVEILRDGNYFGTSFFKSFLAAFLGQSRRDRLFKPYGVAVDSMGRVYVTDTGLGQVFVFDKVEKKVRMIGDAGEGKLSLPTGITIGDSMVFVSDSRLKRVFGYDLQGNLKMAIGAKDEFVSPSGLAYDEGTKRLYVVDTGKHEVRVYDRSGKFLFSFGKRGGGDGEFNYPTNIFVRDGKVYVMDTMNFRVQIFDLNGKFLYKFGSLGDRPGYFSRPKGIAVDSQNHIYVVDAAFDNFQIFDDKGQILLFIGTAGSGPGEFDLPAGIFIDQHDFIYVVDQLNSRVEVFRFLGGN